MIKISKHLDASRIVFLEAQTRDEVLEQLVSIAEQENKLPDRQIFYEAILKREAIVTTGIGMGVAIPHAKIPDLNDFFIVIGILKKGVDWKALDGTPVRLVFMIGGPDNRQAEYLQILSALTSVLKDEGRRRKMVTATTPGEVYSLFHS